MTLSQLRALARSRLDDPLAEAGSLGIGEPLDADCRWKDAELDAWAAGAQIEACLRARLLIDSATAGDADDLPLCALPLVAESAEYSVSPLILAIERLKLPGCPPLAQTNTAELDRESDTWETRTGRPARFVFDRSLGKIRFDRIPDADYSATMTVRRLPLSTPTADSHTFEIPAHYHGDLLDWIEREAYLKRDVDTYDPGKAQAAEARFTATFGERPNARGLDGLLRGSPRRVQGHYL